MKLVGRGIKAYFVKDSSSLTAVLRSRLFYKWFSVLNIWFTSQNKPLVQVILLSLDMPNMQQNGKI